MNFTSFRVTGFFVYVLCRGKRCVLRDVISVVNKLFLRSPSKEKNTHAEKNYSGKNRNTYR
jgi:hypothetical protein